MVPAFAHVTWPTAFEAFGPIAFVVVVATLLVEVPVLKTALGLKWDDAFGSVFFAHLLAIVAFLLIAIPFTPLVRDAATTFELDTSTWWTPWWSRLRWIALTLPGLLWPGAREAMGWTVDDGVGQTVAIAGSVLVQLLVVRSVCDLRWSLRNIGTIIGVAALTASAIVIVLRWPDGAEDDGSADAPVEG